MATSLLVGVVIVILLMSVVTAMDLHPIILIPGLEGCQLQVRLNKTQSSHFWCAKKSGWYTIWLNPALLVPRAVDCFLENMTLDFDAQTNRTKSPPGVEIKVPGFGETVSIEYLTPFPSDLFGSYHELVEELTYIGYEKGQTLLGAPYDFRKAPYENQNYFIKLKKLVEKSSQSNGGRNCIMVCHSFGCINSLYFLQKQSQEWKNKYIRSWITLAAPFGGAIEALQALTSGHDIRLLLNHEKKFRPMERSFSSLTFLLPDERVWKDKPILVHNNTTYRAQDIGEILSLIGHHEGLAMWSMAKNDKISYTHPGVEVHCLRGSFLSTPNIMRYQESETFEDEPNLIYGFGDGTVPDVSGDVCLNWSTQGSTNGLNNIKFFSKTFPFVSHVDMIKSRSVVNYVAGNILAYNQMNFMR